MSRPITNEWQERLNDALASAKELVPPRSEGVREPVLVVTGPPRSGTTLALQLLSSSEQVEVVNHLSACFWTRPEVGVALSRLVKSRDHPPHHTFESDYGLTHGWTEPHEFSYFWRHVLQFDPHAEPEPGPLIAEAATRAAQALDKLGATIAHPVALKGFPALWLGHHLIRASTSVVLAVLDRDTDDVAASIQRGRQAHPRDEWFSLRPLEWRMQLGRAVAEQTRWQAAALTASASALLTPPHPRVLRVAYHDLCNRPDETIDNLLTSARAAVTE